MYPPLCLITSKLDSDSVQTITSGQMLVLASGILAFGIAQTLYVLAFGFQSRNMHTLDLGAFILSEKMSSLQNTPHLSHVCRSRIIVQASDIENIIWWWAKIAQF